MLRRRNWRILQSKHNIFTVLFGVFVCFMTIGYAALTTSLSIDGTTTIAKSTWDVHFANPRGTGNLSNVEIVSSDNTSIQFNALIKPPDGFYKIFIDVVNDGTENAMIKNIDIPAISDNLEYSISYRNGTEVKVNDLLKSKAKETLLIIIKYKENLAAGGVNQNIRVTIDYGQADELAKQPNSSEYNVTSLINLSNGASVDSYTSGVTSEMYAFEHSRTNQLVANTDYRYIGSNPSNYIRFNDEVWRIIGVFPTDDGNGNIQNRIKIVRNEKVANTNISFDYKMTGVGTSTSDNGSNNWIDSQLMYFLNPDDIGTNANNKGYTLDGTLVKSGSNVLYEKGKLPAQVASGATTYTGTENTWQVSADALTKVDSVKYYLSAIQYYGGSVPWGTTENIYNCERYNFINTGGQKSWQGRVGLMYLSDYTYTFAKGVDDTCYKNPGTCNSGTPGNSWLHKTDYRQAFINPYYGNAYYNIMVTGAGLVNIHYSKTTYGIHPTVYLRPDIKLDGSGTVDDPYVIIN